MDVFEALADPTRRRVVLRLADGPLSAGGLAATEPTSRPAVSRHLRILRESGLVDVETDGRIRRYRLRRDPLSAVRVFLDELVQPPIPSAALDGLDLEVRRTIRERSLTHERRQEIS
ncbi:winged helix-turn-helix transcriptional regulator [Microbacterium lushaniae]|nr:winged helix-turn-helix transcriptional regulator [Microbacterium lushaniae]KAA9154088.1 winged helix-turn-helix transcriptional regulator [Microbacterium lushaniae]